MYTYINMYTYTYIRECVCVCFFPCVYVYMHVDRGINERKMKLVSLVMNQTVSYSNARTPLHLSISK